MTTKSDSQPPAGSLGFPIVDAHHHFWDNPHPGALKFGRFLPGDLDAAIAVGRGRVSATVYVDCGWAFRLGGPKHLRCVGETEFVENAATSHASSGSDLRLAAGIVGRADLMLGDRVREVLEAHLAAAPARFRGIRELVGHDPEAYQALAIPQGKVLDHRFREGFRHLAPLGLSCDLLCTHPMLGEVIDLARAFPETSIILNHLAGPIGIGRFQQARAQVFQHWRSNIVDLAECPNVSIKLSGFGAEVMGFEWTGNHGTTPCDAIVAAASPYVDAAIDAFSPRRCMVASNFPVDGRSFTYRTLWDAFSNMLSSYSADEQADLFGGTATRVYRL